MLELHPGRRLRFLNETNLSQERCWLILKLMYFCFCRRHTIYWRNMTRVIRILPTLCEAVVWMHFSLQAKSNPLRRLTKEFIAATGTATSASNSLLNVDTISCTGVEIPDIVATVPFKIYCTLYPLRMWKRCGLRSVPLPCLRMDTSDEWCCDLGWKGLLLLRPH